MKMLSIKKTDINFFVYDEDVKILKGTFDHQNGIKISIYNAYDHKLLQCNSAKNSFKLFQGNKKEMYDCIFENGSTGELSDTKDGCLLEKGAYQYRLYSGIMNLKDMLIGYENSNFIFQIDSYQDETIVFLKDILYADIALFYFIFFHAKDKQYSSTSAFLTNMPEDMMNLL